MDDKAFESMNMVPFIDIMLVLLTIVLMTSSFIVSGKIPLNLPSASNTDKDRDQQRMLELDAEGQLYLDSLPVQVAELDSALTGEDRQTPFLLRADKSIALQKFVDVMDALKTLGFTRVAIQTEAGG
ncbi:biopolymer transporter ExbD [Oceanobacter sp. 4_MG-2023]|jgi:biopolymer transport protein ExbD|uniref:ExbD/TolR family protein n=1 Tax=Oceanobacter sp. 4_MG-2023 TaxID=3062623 RepID=UPI002732B245|nr:biopolymer transporter ExbD [Oceanobacter sp. 4_MG-2023]MDP2548685.1 biopolymer transporter ExbD [Oceanobacter sp. 4_MG-2023]